MDGVGDDASGIGYSGIGWKTSKLRTVALGVTAGEFIKYVLSYEGQKAVVVAFKGTLIKERLADLRGKGALDDEPAMLAGVQRIATQIIAKAVAQMPAAGSWGWKAHLSSTPQVDAESYAGGKLRRYWSS